MVYLFQDHISFDARIAKRNGIYWCVQMQRTVYRIAATVVQTIRSKNDRTHIPIGVDIIQLLKQLRHIGSAIRKVWLFRFVHSVAENVVTHFVIARKF